LYNEQDYKALLKECTIILDNETNDISNYNLARDMLNVTYSLNSTEFKENIELLRNLKLGIEESINTKK